MLIAIAAMSQNRVIGKDNDLPWHYPEDLKRFKRLTKGHTVVMGRKTFESIGRPLPDRKNIVLTRNRDRTADGVKVIHDIDDVIESETGAGSIEEGHSSKGGDTAIYIIGGQQIYQQLLPYCDRIELTLIKKTVNGDAFFPEFEEKFKEITRVTHDDFDFITYKRIENTYI